MKVFDLFSKRQKKLRGEVTDVYTYDTIAQPLRVQVIHIWRDTLGNERQYQDRYVEGHQEAQTAYTFIVETLCREYGLFVLPPAEPYRGRNCLEELANFLLNENDSKRVLDAIELSFRYIDKITRKERGYALSDKEIAELNVRFREQGVGYEYDDGELIRIDSQLLHTETVKPALALLRAEPAYAGAQAEFLTAHEHYRHGRTKEALAECLKALESLMKAICTKRGWTYDPNATANTLIKILFDKGLVPSFWQQHFAALRSTLEAGVPTGRNKLGGHGQGVEVIQVPEHIVAYVLHLTASAIVFLGAAERALP